MATLKRLTLVLLLLPLAVAASPTVLDDDLQIFPVAPGVWRHVSVKDQPGYGRVPANGLIVAGTDSAALIDTPWTDEQTAQLFDWVERELGTKIAHVVVTHSHADCMGGLAEAHRRGAASYASELTAEFAKRDGNPVPGTTFAEQQRVSLGGLDLDLRYFGGGHVRDNIVVWIPQRTTLFGGCLVKRVGGTAGYIDEADLVAWPDTVRKVIAAFPEATVVVPGHGEPGTVEYLRYTVDFAEGLSPVPADCGAELAAVDRKLADAGSLDPHLLQVLKQFRDQGAAECEAGNATNAGAAFESVRLMLEMHERLSAPATAEPTVVTEEPARVVDRLDWAALRERAGTGYPSRWDDLTLVDSCLWVTPGELAERLGLTLRLSAKQDDHQCKYRVHLPNGDSGVLLSVYVEVHEDTEYPREAETGFSTGVGGMQFTPFDAGAPDLHVYLHKRGQYLYAFPQGGRTYWRLGYKPSYGMEEVYRPGAGLEQDIGPRFIKLLVEKYRERL